MGHSGMIPVSGYLLSPFGTGAMPAFMLGGILTTQLFLYSGRRREFEVAIDFVGNCICNPFVRNIYEQVLADIKIVTPALILICSAITIFLFIFVLVCRSQGKGFVVRPHKTRVETIPYYATASLLRFCALVALHLPPSAPAGVIGIVISHYYCGRFGW
jgi:hypothetical protein